MTEAADKPAPTPAFKHVKNNHESLVVVFSAYAARDYGAEAFSYVKDFSRHADKTDLLFVKDVRNQWYNRALNDIGSNPVEITAWLADRIRPYKRVTFFGSSMGGYASLLYGGRLSVDCVVALSPQTFLKAPFPRYSRHNHKGDYIDIATEIGTTKAGRIDVVVAEEDLFDIYQMNKLPQMASLHRTLVPGGFHNIPLIWTEDGKLPQAVEAIATGTWEGLIEDWRRAYGARSILERHLGEEAFRKTIADAVEARYEGRHTDALAALKALTTAVPDWMGAWSVMGIVKIQAGALFDGLDCLHRVRARNSTIDDFFRPLARTLAMLRQSESAIDAASEGFRRNKNENRTIFADLETIFTAYERPDLAARCRKLAEK